VLEELVKENDFEYENIQESIRKNDKISILTASFKRTYKVYRTAKKFKADVLIGTDSSIAQSAFLLKKVSFTTLEDDYEVIKKLAKLTYPFSTSIVVPSVCEVGKKYGKKKIPYYGYMKLAYLHPNRFIPNEDIVKKYINAPKYCIIRLAKLTAHHDEGIKGLNTKLVENIVDIVEKKGYIPFISSESELAFDLQKYQLEIHKNDIHHVMAFASLLVSDSQSMSVEAAMLGVPSIRFSDFAGRISVLEELENNYELTFGIPTNQSDKLLTLIENLLSDENIKAVFQKRKEKMLSEKIDVTSFLTWFIENYPESEQIMKENPDFQHKFK